MEDKRLRFGFTLTIIWVCFSASMLITHERPSELNAWGDFFAGFFSPLAFLWLVLGYLQQGEELKHSTSALELQAIELRNSVEQQSQLVAVSREQMKQEYETLQEERELRRDAARPKFIPQHSGTSVHVGIAEYNLKIVNVGNTATKIRMNFDPPIQIPKNLNVAIAPRNEVLLAKLRFGSLSLTKCIIKYIDAEGHPGEVNFALHLLPEHKLEISDVIRII